MVEGYEGVKFKVERFQRAPLPKDCLEKAAELSALAKKLAGMGLEFESGGNISVRVERGFLIKPAGKSFGELEPDDFVLVREFDSEGFVLNNAVGNSEPSSETGMHACIYSSHPEVNAVVHTNDLELAKKCVPKIPRVGPQPYGTKRLSREVCTALEGSVFVVLEGHGVVAVGASVEEAFQNLVSEMKRAF